MMILSQTKSIYSSAVSTSVFKLTYTGIHFKVKNGRKFFSKLCGKFSKNHSNRVVNWAENQIVLVAKLRYRFQNQIEIAKSCEKL